jgi:hypothetical protein
MQFKECLVLKISQISKNQFVNLRVLKKIKPLDSTLKKNIYRKSLLKVNFPMGHFPRNICLDLEGKVKSHYFSLKLTLFLNIAVIQLEHLNQTD